jgi:hypothetical protein
MKLHEFLSNHKQISIKFDSIIQSYQFEMMIKKTALYRRKKITVTRTLTHIEITHTHEDK